MTGVDTHRVQHRLVLAEADVHRHHARSVGTSTRPTMSARKWTQVLFVDDADATRYPIGDCHCRREQPSRAAPAGSISATPSPEFRQDAPNNGIFPEGGTLAGLKIGSGIFDWFQNQDTWTSRRCRLAGAAARASGGADHRQGGPLQALLSRISRTTRSWSRRTRPTGSAPVRIPVRSRRTLARVVFEDDNYNPRRTTVYDPNVLTWHWDNIQVFATAAVRAAGRRRPVGRSLRRLPPISRACPSPGGETALGRVSDIARVERKPWSPARPRRATSSALVLTIVGLAGPAPSVGPLRRLRSGGPRRRLRPERPSEEA